MSVLIGLGIIAFLFMYMAFRLDDKHAVIKVVSLIFAVLTMMAISSYVLNNQDHCDIVVTFSNETTPTASETDIVYSYERVCFESSTEGSGLSIFKLMNYFVRILQWYSFIFIIYWIFDYFGINLLEKAKQLIKGK